MCTKFTLRDATVNIRNLVFMSSSHALTITPDNKPLAVDSGTTLLKALVDHSVFLRSDCGGRGVCGKCLVQQIQPDGTKEEIYACTQHITRDLTITIPQSSLLSTHVITKAPATFPPSFKKRQKNRKTIGKAHGIAVDLGTTTIAVYLCQTGNREVISSVAVKNPQSLYGDDVMSRIGAIDMQHSLLDHLQKIVVNAIGWGITLLLEKAGLDRNTLAKMVVVGNPTMIHILIGVNPSPLGRYPYTPVFHEARNLNASDIGFSLNHVSLHTFPQITGFIGGDILSAALAVDIERQPEGTLLIDLGTNGELLFKDRKTLYATSCATGPAFEGATLSCGMQAIPGAINRISIVDNSGFPDYTTVNSYGSGHNKPFGVCGTGVISSIAELCRHGIIEPSGAFTKASTIQPLVHDDGNRLKYILIPEDKTQDGKAIYISQKDVRSVQLGKAAIITGIEFLVKAAGYDRPNKIIIAGAFGTFIAVEDMFTLGMLPTMAAGQVERVGNSAGAGAVMALCDDTYLQKATEMASQVVTVDLACDIQFQEVFVQKLRFPH
jgi:uncharacterized 2Fe-2S/4Fe-4S cluster protein (DUF4445 family)